MRSVFLWLAQSGKPPTDLPLIVKAFDGDSLWPQYKPYAGREAAWGYLYPSTSPATILRVLREAPMVVLDAEGEWEGPQGLIAARNLAKVLRPYRDRLAFTSFAWPSLHATFPWQVFASFCSVGYPQVYWRDMGVEPEPALRRALREWPKGMRLVPVGQGYGAATTAEITRFISAAGTDTAWWELYHASRAQLGAIERG